MGTKKKEWKTKTKFYLFYIMDTPNDIGKLSLVIFQLVDGSQSRFWIRLKRESSDFVVFLDA